MKKLNDELNLNLNLKKTKVREVRGPIIAWGAAGAAVVICAVFVSLFFVRRNCILNVKSCELSAEEILHFENVMDSAGYERRNTIHPLPYKMQYKTNAPELEIKAGAAILINADTGDIIFEKNADELIPPASMTKLFLMYTVFKKIDEGKASLDDVVPIDERSWASKMPPSSSLMFLGKGQVVTLRELLLGLAVCSGNDASHAVAFYLFDDMDSFLNEVNSTIKKAGLEKTRIVEPSGYSEFNVTTAREMAAFSRIYINEYPDSLKLFHSVKKFVYPLEKNLLPEFKNREAQDFSKGIPDTIWTPVVQRATNTMLKTLEGCDGLKTGHIKESGYNIALTCKRGGERYISVTMKGPGNSMAEGDKFRVADGTALQEFAFDNFYESDDYRSSFDVKVLGAKENGVKLVAAYPVKTVLPLVKERDGQVDDGEPGEVLRVKREVSFYVDIPPYLFGEVECGKQYGSVKLLWDGHEIMNVPLVASKDIKKSNAFIRAVDHFVAKTIK